MSEESSTRISSLDDKNTSKPEQEAIIRHEIRAYTTHISRTIHTTTDKINYLVRKISKKLDGNSSELDMLRSINRNLSHLNQEIIPTLHSQLEYQKELSTLLRLGIYLDIAHETINVAEFISRQMETFSQEQNKKRIYSSFQLSPNINVETHSIALWHIFDNILSNIFKYAIDNSVFYISSDNLNSKVIYFKNRCICDINHPAISEDLMRFGARGSTDRNHIDGDGIGLYLVKFLSKNFLGKEFKYNIGEPTKKPSTKKSINTEYWFQEHIITLDFSKVAIK